MADQTSATEELSPEEVTSHLHELGDAFSEDESTINVGNKTVTVHPPAQLTYEISVTESSSLLSGETETVSLELRWQPGD